MKNITIPSHTAYLKALISKVEHFLKRMRWKAFFYEKEHRENDDSENEDNEEEDEEATFNFGFKSPRTPPGQPLLKPFESAMYQMITDIKFKDRPNTFQQKLKEDVRRIRSSEKLLIPADKSTNLYEVKSSTTNYSLIT